MSEQLMKCPQCGAPVDPNVTSCKFCGAGISAQAPVSNQQFQQQGQQQQYQQPQVNVQVQAPQYIQPVYDQSKSKVVAGILGIFLGGIGIHKFYLGRIGAGILFLLFCWTGIPAIIGFIEGIIFLASSDDNFRAKYCRRLN